MENLVQARAQEAENRTAHLKESMTIVSMYNLVPYKDGDHWCVLLGVNIQEGICGFGKTPMLAIEDFNRKFYNS